MLEDERPERSVEHVNEGTMRFEHVADLRGESMTVTVREPLELCVLDLAFARARQPTVLAEMDAMPAFRASYCDSGMPTAACTEYPRLSNSKNPRNDSSTNTRYGVPMCGRQYWRPGHLSKGTGVRTSVRLSFSIVVGGLPSRRRRAIAESARRCAATDIGYGSSMRMMVARSWLFFSNHFAPRR